jgi:hypothetical protein
MRFSNLRKDTCRHRSSPSDSASTVVRFRATWESRAHRYGRSAGTGTHFPFARMLWLNYRIRFASVGNPARVLGLEKPGLDQPISDKTVWIACGDACNAAAESSSLWHCPRCGVSMIVVHRFTVAEDPHALTSILRGVCTSFGPGMCSRTQRRVRMRLPHGDRFSHRYLPRSCRHVRRYQRSRPGLSASPGLASLDLAGNWRSNPIAHRVRRKRQRFPPSLLSEGPRIEIPAPPQESAPRRF